MSISHSLPGIIRGEGLRIQDQNVISINGSLFEMTAANAGSTIVIVSPGAVTISMDSSAQTPNSVYQWNFIVTITSTIIAESATLISIPSGDVRGFVAGDASGSPIHYQFNASPIIFPGARYFLTVRRINASGSFYTTVDGKQTLSFNPLPPP